MSLYLENLWTLFVDMSFYIVIGLIFTGLLHVFIKKDTILKQIGRNNTSSVVKAAIFGVPLPLCSCGVVPTAMYLGKSGASKGAVVSFLTSTPQTGVDSLIATYGMMGPIFAVYRAVAAFISGIISGIATNILCAKDKINYGEKVHSCCGHSHEKEENIEVKEEAHCCCHKHKEGSSDNNKKAKSSNSFISKIKDALEYGFVEFLDEIVVHFIIGLLIAALISTLLPANILSSFENPFITMILMVIIGIPMYICSTGSIPIAVSLMVKGVSPGAAFVFLFAGPVTNVASLSILIKTLGKKVTAIYLSAVAVCSIAFGLIFDFLIDKFNITSIYDITAHVHGGEQPKYMIVVALLFGMLVLRSLVSRVIDRVKNK